MRRATHRRVRQGGAGILLLSLWLQAAACGSPTPVTDATVPAAVDTAFTSAGARDDASWFVDHTEASGIDFVHRNGMTGTFHMAEVTGAGAALLDVDGDGDLDVYLVQGGALPGAHGTGATIGLGDRLYRNERRPAGDPPTFVDITETSGIVAQGYGMGVVSGDIDNDGLTDLYVTNFGPNQLLRNRGDGTFEDITRASGTDDPRWSVPATFLDFDRDGWLDLYIGNYVAYDDATRPACHNLAGADDYCGPGAFPPEPDRLLRNRGDGTFVDVTHPAGLGIAAASLAALAADLDGDGWIDLYVANDGAPNHLWRNRGDGTFVEDAHLAGCAVNHLGQPEASMGVAAGDLDGDGDLDLLLTHLGGETNTLYRNLGQGLFDDHTRRLGLGSPSLPFTSFGTGFLDVDNDGWLDLLAVSGAVQTIDALRRGNDPFPLHQTNQLFHNRGDGTFVDHTARAGPAFLRSAVSRGAAFGDLDDDGDTDVLITNTHGAPQLLLNQVGQDRPWIGLRLQGGSPARDQPGAWVRVTRRDAPPLWRRAATDGSYGSAHDPRLVVGLGDRPEVLAIEVHWPDGQQERWPAPPLRRYTTLHQGQGTP